MNNPLAQLSQNSLPSQFSTANGSRLRGSVRQDNLTPPRARTASPQPAPPKKEMRSTPKEMNTPRIQQAKVQHRQTVHTTLWLKPRVRAELERKAKEEGLSISSTGAALLEWALQQSIYTQHAALLETILDKAIGKHMRAYSNRLALLLVRSLYASEQTRSIVTNILSRQDGMTQKDLATIITASDTKARSNITRITPQLKTLIEAVQKELAEEVNAHA